MADQSETDAIQWSNPAETDDTGISHPAPTSAASVLAARWIDQAIHAPVVGAPSFSLADLTWLDAFRTQATDAPDSAARILRDDMLAVALHRLDPLSRDIVTARRLLDRPIPAETLAARLDLPPDRIAALEHRAFAALQAWMRIYVAERRTRPPSRAA